MDLDQIETFLAVVATGSFSRAARRLNTTQPNVSVRIAALERSLGKRLLDRSARVVVPTPEGRAFIAYADKMIALRSEATIALSDPRRLTGVVRLGVSETIVHAWLPELIREVARSFPAVDLEITVDTTNNLRELLVAREIDAGLLMGPVSEPHMSNRPLCVYPMGWIAAPSLDVPRRALALADLARHPLITYSRKTRPTLSLLRKLQKAGVEGVRLFASASLATNIRLAEEGVGIATMPPFLVQREIKQGSLRQLKVAEEGSLDPLDFTVTHLSSGSMGLVERIADLALDCARRDHKNSLWKSI